MTERLHQNMKITLTFQDGELLFKTTKSGSKGKKNISDISYNKAQRLFDKAIKALIPLIKEAKGIDYE